MCVPLILTIRAIRKQQAKKSGFGPRDLFLARREMRDFYRDIFHVLLPLCVQLIFFSGNSNDGISLQVLLLVAPMNSLSSSASLYSSNV